MSASNGNNGNGPSRLVGLDGGLLSPRNAKDSEGRLLRHNATVHEAHQIAVEEHTKVHEFYLRQIPEFVARMLMDGLAAHGLLGLQECPSCGAISRVGPAIPDDDAAAKPCRFCASTAPMLPLTPPELLGTPAENANVAEVAQQVEQRPRNAQADGSSPSLSSPPMGEAS